MAPKEKKVIVKRPPKTLKERRFVKELINNGGNKVQAALVAYDTDNYKSATRIAHENTEKLRMPDIMEQEGLTDTCLVTVLKDGLVAMRRSTSFTEPDQIDPDFGIRHKYLETALKLKGHMKLEEGATNNYLQFIQTQNNGYRPENTI